MAEESVRSLLSWLSAVGHVPSNSHEALALAVHGLLVQHGFRPEDAAVDDEVRPTGEQDGTGENTGEGDATNDTTPVAPATPQPRLPNEWGAAGYGGRYRHHRSSLTFDIRAVAVGPRLVVHGTTVENDETLNTLELRVDTYVRDGVDLAGLATRDGDAQTNWADVFDRTNDLATLVQVNIAHRLVPDAAKAGYEAGPAAAAQSASAGSAARAAPTRADDPSPLRDDRFRRREPPMGMPRMPPGYGDGDFGGIGVGHDDLVAPGLPMPGGMFGGGGGFGGPLGGGGGNLMGPRHPGFGGPGGVFPGGGVGGGRLPPGAVPPGARFDPFGPPDPYAGYGPGGPGMRQPPRGGATGPGSGVPDNDIERPPAPDGDGEADDPPPPDMYY